MSLLFTTFAAFALAKLKFKGRQLMMDINQLALMFVATAVLIPRYLVICKVGLIDSIWAHILPLLAYPVALFLVKQVWVNMETSNYYVNDDSMKTLTFYMNSLVNVNNTVSGQGMAAAASLILFVPNLVLFIILQNNVMNTMAHSGIK